MASGLSGAAANSGLSVPAGSRSRRFGYSRINSRAFFVGGDNKERFGTGAQFTAASTFIELIMFAVFRLKGSLEKAVGLQDVVYVPALL